MKVYSRAASSSGCEQSCLTKPLHTFRAAAAFGRQAANSFPEPLVIAGSPAFNRQPKCRHRCCPLSSRSHASYSLVLFLSLRQCLGDLTLPGPSKTLLAAPPLTSQTSLKPPRTSQTSLTLPGPRGLVSSIKPADHPPACPQLPGDKCSSAISLPGYDTSSPECASPFVLFNLTSLSFSGPALGPAPDSGDSAHRP